MRHRLKRIAIGGIAALMLALPAQSLGQDATQTNYFNPDLEFVGNGEPSDRDGGTPGGGTGTGTAATADGDPGGLPFTGVEVGLVALAGVALVAVGLGMRARTRGADTG